MLAAGGRGGAPAALSAIGAAASRPPHSRGRTHRSPGSRGRRPRARPRRTARGRRSGCHRDAAGRQREQEDDAARDEHQTQCYQDLHALDVIRRRRPSEGLNDTTSAGSEAATASGAARHPAAIRRAGSSRGGRGAHPSPRPSDARRRATPRRRPSAECRRRPRCSGTRAGHRGPTAPRGRCRPAR